MYVTMDFRCCTLVSTDENTDIIFVLKNSLVRLNQSYEIKSPPLTILWFRILGIFSVENKKRLCVFMFQACSIQWSATEKSTVNKCTADYCLKFKT